MSSGISPSSHPASAAGSGQELLPFHPSLKVREVAQKALLSDAFFAHSTGGLTAAFLAVEMAKMPQGMDRMLHAIHEYFHENSPSILENLRSYSENIDRILTKLDRVCEDLSTSLASGRDGYREQKKSLERMIPIIRRMISVSQTSYMQVLHMTGIGFGLQLQGYQEVLSVMAFARLKDLDLLETHLTQLQAEENYELTIAVNLYTLQIEEEGKKFDQLLKVLHVLDQEQEEKELRRLSIERQAKKEKAALCQLDERRQKAVDSYVEKMGKLIIEHEGLTHKIDAPHREQILKALHERASSRE
jgi:flagellar motor component MotA